MALQPVQSLSLETTLERYLRSLDAKNRSAATINAYRADLTQFVSWLRETNATIETPNDVERRDITEHLGALSGRRLSGVSQARKLAAIREYFRFAEIEGFITASPVKSIDTAEVEKRGRNYLTPEEYNRPLAVAGGTPRDYCILMTFLQTGVRVSELCILTFNQRHRPDQ